MKKKVIIISLFTSLIVIGSIAWAQDEFTLEEITVTSEKREVNVQKIPASVDASTGIALQEQGKITIQQILEGVPNVKVGGGVVGIAIRGVQAHSAGSRAPAATATYVDEIFEGIGGQYDIERVEVLRGPQGTLYGRSATGGVIAFHTKDPDLTGFSGYITGEIGEANLKNFQGAINIPITDVFAIRAAAHTYEKDGYFNPDGGRKKTREARIKLLYAPSEALRILLTGSKTDNKSNSGGYSPTLVTPTEFDYTSRYSPVGEGAWDDHRMLSLKINYDFGDFALDYIGSYRVYQDRDQPDVLQVQHGPIQRNGSKVPNDKWKTHELRLTSDSDGRLTWLIGTNFFMYDYYSTAYSYHYQTYMYPGGPPDPDPNTIGALVWSDENRGEVTNYGLFTEETFSVSDRMRITGGLRFDKTELDGYSGVNMNMNKNEYGNSVSPADIKVFKNTEVLEFDNITYKLRLEYDVTPDNMLYALTSTGFLPGNFVVGSRLTSFVPMVIDLFKLDYGEEKLTAYEIGSKNRLLNNRLQLNASAFFYDYEGFRHNQNVATLGQMPENMIIPTPLEMYGVELSTDWLVTANDRVTLNLGYMKAYITEYPVFPLYGDMQYYMVLRDVPGIPHLTATLNYEHTFILANGSTLVPRGTVRYTDGMYLSNLTQPQVDRGQLPYAWQDSYIIGDIGATWTSPGGMYSITGYIRNVTDKEYKYATSLSATSVAGTVLTPGDPRTWGIVATVRF